MPGPTRLQSRLPRSRGGRPCRGSSRLAVPPPEGRAAAYRGGGRPFPSVFDRPVRTHPRRLGEIYLLQEEGGWWSPGRGDRSGLTGGSFPPSWTRSEPPKLV